MSKVIEMQELKKPGRVGVVYAGMVLRADHANRQFVKTLEAAGAVVKTVNLFEGQTVGQPTLSSLPPPWKGKDAEANWLAEVVAALDHAKILAAFHASVRVLREEQGCAEVFLVGKGLGGVYALHAAKNTPVDGVFAFYPHLTLPNKVVDSGLHNPDLRGLPCSVMIYQGDDDTKLSQRHVARGGDPVKEYVADLVSAAALPGGTVSWHIGAKHAFMDRWVNLFPWLRVPSPLYSHEAARTATCQVMQSLNVSVPYLC